MNSSYVVSVLGPVHIDYPDALPSRRFTQGTRRLLAMLVAADRAGVGIDRIVERIDHSGPANSAAARMAVARLREHLPPGAIPSASRGLYRLDLPRDHVDAWYLADLVGRTGLSDADASRLQHLIRFAEPFEGVSSVELDAAADSIRALQRSLILRVGAERPHLIDESIVDAAIAHLRADRLNEVLLRVVVSWLWAVGDRPRALRVIQTARSALAEVGLDLDQRTIELEYQVLIGESVDTAMASRVDLFVTSGTSMATQRSVHVGDRSALDAAEAWAASDPLSVPLIVRGGRGTGTSHILGAAGSIIERRGGQVVSWTPTREPVPYGLFLSMSDSMCDVVAGLLRSDADSMTKRALIWSAARRWLADIAEHRPVLLAVDPLDRADSQSETFLEHLATRPDANVAVAMTVTPGRSRTIPEPDAVAAAERAGAVVVEPALLSAADLERSLLLARPAIDRATAIRIAAATLRGTGGRAGLAFRMVGRWEPGHPAPCVEADEVDRRSIAALTVAARDVLLILALRDEPVEAEAVAALTETGIDVVLDALDELEANGLAIECSPVQFRVESESAAQAAIDASSRRDVARWCERLASVAGDVHRRARLLADAVPLVERSVAARALAESARDHLSSGLYLEAVARFERAAGLLPSAPDVRFVSDFSRACDMAGLHERADQVRADVLDALLMDEPEAAIAVITSGLPEAEPVDGSATLVDRLSSVRTEELPRTVRWNLARHLARQCAIVGRVDDATEAARRCAELARTGDERLTTAFVTRIAGMARSHPRDRMALLDAVEDIAARAPAHLRHEFALLRALDLFESGLLDRCRSAVDRIASESMTPIRRWHVAMLQASLLSDAGEREFARELREEALHDAARSGLHEAGNAYAMANLAAQMVAGDVSMWSAIVDHLIPTADEAVVRRAAISYLLLDVGRAAEAVTQAERVVDDVMAAPVPQSPTAVAIASFALEQSEGDDRRAAARRFLQGRADAFIVVGAGVASLGPAARYLARLATDRTEAAQYIRQAHDVAVAAGSPVWAELVAAECAVKDPASVTQQADR